ncbi:membrane protein insertion efficiency factor YidD [Methanoregula sp.]|uniref:membrane protein insertion efficiency factor YidD n=1 Tax=Methanoregula sp. TaxID=2052170 RepID=UPI003C1B9645
MKFNEVPSNLCIKMIKFHQNHISHHLNKRGIRCRFYPTCSEYGIMAIQKYGVFKGIRKTWNRLTRCRPDNFESCIDYP